MDWKTWYQEHLCPPQQAVRRIRSGDRVVVAHATGEPSLLLDAMVANAAQYEHVEIVHMVAMGKAEYCQPAYDRNFHHNSFFLGATSRAAAAEGRADFTPVYFSEIPALLRDHLHPNVALIQVSPPDEHGYCSLGVSVDYTKTAAASPEPIDSKRKARCIPMTQFVIHPSIWQYDTCQAFAQDFHLGPQDLLLTNEFLYTPYFAPLNPPCPVLFQEKYGLGEPSDEMVEAIYRDMPKEVTRVIAVGGGGVLDIAKLLVLQHVTPILDLYDGKLPLQKARDLVLVPTTCGTGSEVTNISILALLSRRTKKGLAHESMFADQAVLIPELLKGLPFSVFATSSIDALIHAIESSLSPKASATTKLFGYQAIAWILKGYLAIRDQGPDARFPLLSQFLLASNYAGIAFGNAGCAAVHALSYPLGAVYHVPHGESNYAMFTGVMKQYLAIRSDGAIAELNAFLAQLLDCPPEAVYEALEDLLSCLLPKKALHEYGMQEHELAEFTDSVLANQQRLLQNNFVPLSREQIYAIYRSLY